MNRFIEINDDAFTFFECKNKTWNFAKMSWYSRPYEYKWMVNTVKTLGDNLTILDAACGFKTPGHMMLAECENVTRITAQDLGIGYASSFLTNGLDHPKVTKVKSDLRTWTPDKEYDVVVCISSLEHIPNYPQALNTMYQALKPGGHCLLTIDISKDKKPNPHLQNYNVYPDEYKEMLEEQGFKLIGDYDGNINENSINGAHSKFTGSKHVNLHVFRFLLQK